MRFGLSLLMVVVLATAATAQQVVPVGIQAEDGMYVLTIQNGKVTSLTPLPILRPDGPAPPVPPTPTPDDLTERAKAVMEAALDVESPDRAKTAQAMAELYRQIAGKISDGDIPSQEAAAFAIQFGTNRLLSGQQRQAWQPVRDVITEQWTDVLQRGGSLGDYATLLGEVAEGLDASAPGDPQIDIQMIIMIIEMILEILKMLPF